MRKFNGSSQAGVGLGSAPCTLRVPQPRSLDASNTIMKAHIAGRPGNLLLATLGGTYWDQGVLGGWGFEECG